MPGSTTLKTFLRFLYHRLAFRLPYGVDWRPAFRTRLRLQQPASSIAVAHSRMSGGSNSKLGATDGSKGENRKRGVIYPTRNPAASIPFAALFHCRLVRKYNQTSNLSSAPHS